MGNGRIIVSNSTPLINFAAIRRMDILSELFNRIYVPMAVERELMEKGDHYPSKSILEPHWSKLINVMEAKNTTLTNVLRLNLDDGEAEAIALAIEHNAKMLLLDETGGRIIAESYGLPIIGSIGCLIRAKRMGMISEVRPLLDAMMTKARFWVNAQLYSTILKENGE